MLQQSFILIQVCTQKIKKIYRIMSCEGILTYMTLTSCIQSDILPTQLNTKKHLTSYLKKILGENSFSRKE